MRMNGLFDRTHEVLVYVYEINKREYCECKFEGQYGLVMFHRHEIALLKYVEEDEHLKEQSAA